MSHEEENQLISKDLLGKDAIVASKREETDVSSKVMKSELDISVEETESSSLNILSKNQKDRGGRVRSFSLEEKDKLSENDGEVDNKNKKLNNTEDNYNAESKSLPPHNGETSSSIEQDKKKLSEDRETAQEIEKDGEMLDHHTIKQDQTSIGSLERSAVVSYGNALILLKVSDEEILDNENDIMERNNNRIKKKIRPKYSKMNLKKSVYNSFFL